MRTRFMPGACARYSNPVYTKRIVELKHGRYTAKDVPHLVSCLPRLQPFTEGCVYRRFNFALTWNLSLVILTALPLQCNTHPVTSFFDTHQIEYLFALQRAREVSPNY